MSWSWNESTLAITMTKGDTPTIPIRAIIEDEDGVEVPYIPEDEDVIVFAVKAKGDKEPIFSVEVPHDTMAVTFKEEYTKDLSENSSYIYEVSLNVGEYHETFIENKKLKLTTEVY